MMHDLTERSDLVQLHGRAQSIPMRDTTAILARIDSLDDGPGGWATEWSSAASAQLERGDRAGAIARWNLARFPFADTADAVSAHARCVATAGDLAAERGIRRLEFDDSAAWYLPAPHASPSAPLLVVCGGIVSIKEQWFSLFALGGRLGFGVLLTELPGVGENSAPYAADAADRLSALLDVVPPFRSAYAIAMSFGGAVALKAAARDRRITGIFSVGPPIRHFFRDPGWWPRVPQTTKDSLVATTGVPERDLPAALSALAIEDDELASVGASITAVASLRDEIIPIADPRLLLATVPRACVIAYDDVHGSPHHVLEVRLRMFAEVAASASPRRPLLSNAAKVAARLRRSEKSLP